ncbi:MAG: RNA-directed DNA polymerase, partial [Candidatus Omnitrophica bacterium]|nr:RNA-directed DNA polymerase [Candidatus Omnitrophota bacterium]
MRRATRKERREIPSHLKEIYEDAIEGKSRAEADKIADILIKHQDVFSRDETDLGLTNLTEHAIDTGDAKPVKQPPRRIPMAFQGEDKTAVQKMLKQKIVRPSTSAWASPIVLVRKKDGSVRTCIDYRRLNFCTKIDSYALPKTSECLDAMAGAKWFSTLDITSAYHQVPVKKEDIPKTAFVTREGLFEFVTMPMGLVNSAATFQRCIELALSGLAWTFCVIYLDDVIVFGKDIDEHLERLDAVLSRIKLANLKLKPKKCFLLKKSVKFLGHIVSADGLLPDPDNVEKLVKWPVPKTVTEVRGILGLGSYYRRSIRDYSKKLEPLIELTKKDKPFEWTSRCQEAFDALKEELTGPEVMAYPNETGTFILDTDA